MTHKIFMIAGEASGDVLGASLMRGLKAHNPDIQFEGVGGDLMAEQGLESLISMQEITAIGIFEVALRFSELLKRIQELVEEIEKRQPDVFVSIDLPDFNFQVAKRLKQRGIFKGKILHYVAPTVWAWRPGRAKKISAFVDGVMCLFPFEPDYFKPHGMDAVYVGHTIIEDAKPQDKHDAQALLQIEEDELAIGVYFGSRESEIKRHAKIFTDVLKDIHHENPKMSVIAPTLPAREYDVRKALEDLPCDSFVISDSDQKWTAMAACDFAIAVSGTVGLELSYMNVSHMIAYKMNPLTWWLVRSLIKVKHAHLGNILMGREIVPEFLQGACKPLLIADRLSTLLKSEEALEKQKQDFTELHTKLHDGVQSPSHDAAAFVVKYLKH